MRPKILIPRWKVEQRIDELAHVIERNYHTLPLFVVLLDGAKPFADLLLERLVGTSTTNRLDLRVKSYKGTEQGEVVISYPGHANPGLIARRDVVIVDDILDTGKTLAAVGDHLLAQHARTVKAVTLLRRKRDEQPVVRLLAHGFDIHEEFVVGFGMDYNNKFREWNDICYLETKQ